MGDPFADSGEQFWDGWDSASVGSSARSSQQRIPHPVSVEAGKAIGQLAGQAYDPENHLDTAEEMWAGLDEDEEGEGGGGDGDNVESLRPVEAGGERSPVAASPGRHSVTPPGSPRQRPRAASELMVEAISLGAAQLSPSAPGGRRVLLPRVAVHGLGDAGGGTMAECIAHATRAVRKQLAVVPDTDLVVLPDALPLRRGSAAAMAESLAEAHRSCLEALTGVARELGVMVCFGSVHRGIGEKGLRHSIFLLDRQGKVCASHSKRTLSREELLAGFLPGEKLTTVATDVGTVALCFDSDLNGGSSSSSSSSSSSDAIGGARLVLCLGNEAPELRLRALALDAECWLVRCARGRSVVVDAAGSVTWRATRVQPSTSASINLARRLLRVTENSLGGLALLEARSADVRMGQVPAEEDLLWVEPVDGAEASLLAALNDCELQLVSQEAAMAATLQSRIAMAHGAFI